MLGRYVTFPALGAALRVPRVAIDTEQISSLLDKTV